jgi:hypothetical protein
MQVEAMLAETERREQELSREDRSGSERCCGELSNVLIEIRFVSGPD